MSTVFPTHKGPKLQTFKLATKDKWKMKNITTRDSFIYPNWQEAGKEHRSTDRATLDEKMTDSSIDLSHLPSNTFDTNIEHIRYSETTIHLEVALTQADQTVYDVSSKFGYVGSPPHTARIRLGKNAQAARTSNDSPVAF